MWLSLKTFPFFLIKEINFGLNWVWKLFLSPAKREECVTEKWIGTDTHLMQAEESRVGFVGNRNTVVQ